MKKEYRTLSFISKILVIMLVTTLVFGANIKKKNAGLAMIYCFAPGGGQFYTERYLPGIIIGASELTIGYYAYKFHQNEEYTKRNSMLWWGLFVFGFSLADAYVGAKMYGFDMESDIDRIGFKYTFKW